MSDIKDLKVALVHDWLNQYGGAERVLDVLHAMFPAAPIYTSIYDPDAMPLAYRDRDIRVTWMNRLPFAKKHHQLFLPLYPLAFENLDLSEYDLVISNKSGFCHGVITAPHTTHICYCLTPTRYMWDFANYAQRESLGGLKRAALVLFLHYLRVWDRLAADRVDYFIAISSEVQRRIAKFYRRESTIIYPPVQVGKWTNKSTKDTKAHEGANQQISKSANGQMGMGDYFLIISRLIPYKRIDLAVQAFNELRLPLVIVGEGRDRAALEALARPNIRFLGRLSDDEASNLLTNCRAFIFPGLEDFGIAPLEAQAAGKPVIAYAGGGALDTVVEGVTGAFFHEQTAEALAEVVQEFNSAQYDAAKIQRHAARFDEAVFRESLRRFIAACGDYCQSKRQTHRNQRRAEEIEGAAGLVEEAARILQEMPAESPCAGDSHL